MGENGMRYAIIDTRLAAIEALSAFGAEATGVLPRLRVWQKDSDLRLKTAADKAVTAIEGAVAGGRREAPTR
jgi:hypothetical protein